MRTTRAPPASPAIDPHRLGFARMPAATAAGCRTTTVPDPGSTTPIPVVVLHPTDAPAHPTRLGPYTLDVAMDAPVAAGTYPLVLVSHGTGGSHLAYRDLAAHLARAGFVVALVEHPGNSRNDNSRADTDANLAARPRHLRRAADHLYADAALGPHLAADAVAIVGHSMGGYTALAAAGGRPTAFAREMADGRAREVPVAPDDRVRALVLLAPATPWFMAPGALADVRVPILMLTAEHDPHTPEGHAEIVRRGLPPDTPLEHRVVPNAGHFSFLSPFPAAMTHAAFAPSQDPPGFDRARFHDAMHAEVTAFLRRTL